MADCAAASGDRSDQPECAFPTPITSTASNGVMETLVNGRSVEACRVRRANLWIAAALVLNIFAIVHHTLADEWLSSFDGEVPFEDYVHRRYSTSDGLPSNWVNDVIQSRDDYLWIATDDGLVRYDGVHFKIFNHTVTQRLPYNEIRVLFEDSGGDLWFGTTEGLTRYRPGRPGKFEQIQSVSGTTVWAICEDSSQALWIGTRRETYRKKPGLEFEVLADAPTNVRSICEDQNGTVWLGSQSGLFRRNGTHYEQVFHERLPERSSAGSGVPQTRVNTIKTDNAGGLWIGTNRTLLHMQDGQFTSRGQEIEAQQFYDILQTRDGNVYAAARFGIYRSVDNGPFEIVSNEDSALCIIEDREGELWVGHGDNRGLHQYRDRHIRSFWTKARVRCVHQEPDGDMWFGSNIGLHRLHNGTVTDFDLSHGLPDLRVRTIAPGAGRSLWIGTGRGFVKWNGESIVPIPTQTALAEMNVGTAMEDSTGALWFSLASGGGYQLKDDVLTELPDSVRGPIYWFWEGPQGDIWIGHQSGLFQYREGRLRQVTTGTIEGSQNPIFYCHHVTEDGTLWMGTSNGLIRYQSDRFEVFTPDCGLRADNVERLAADHSGNLWFGGRDGLFHARISEFDEVATGRLQNVTSYRVAGFDRFPPISSFSQGCLERNGNLWIVAEHGLLTIPIEQFQEKPRSPTASIEHVEIDGEATNFESRFDYGAGRRRLAIHFAVPAFENPSHIQMRYRLDPYDDDWVGAGDDRVAYYTDLRPGKYQFRVSARTGNEDWTESEPPVSFSVLPRWWETGQFHLFSTIGVVGLIVLGTRRYTQQVRRRNAELQSEITERIHAETALRESEQRFRQLAESTQAIPWEANASTLQMTFVGSQAEELLGYSVEDWMKSDFWAEHLHQEDKSEAIAFRRHAVSQGGSHQTEYRFIAATGAAVWLHEVLHVANRNGVSNTLSGFLIDVTVRRNAEENARESFQQLARVSRAASMGELTTSIAHEVKQPLFAIVSNAQTARRLLDREQPDLPEIREALGDIASDGNRASDIIDHVRSLVRKEDRAKEPLDLNDVAGEVIKIVRPELRKRGLTIRAALSDTLPSIDGVAIELQQVILNLIINGAQAMEGDNRDENELLITTSAHNDSVELSVRDFGVGLECTQAQRIFEPFYTTKANGTGMGLAINRTIIEAHGGKIWAESNGDCGATFCFRLPTSNGTGQQ